ncbi:MAG: hypothetical protein WKF73_18835 [Nocardioidaceae bacterium]
MTRADGPGAPTEEGLSRRWDRPMGALGVVFLLVVLGQTLAEDPRLVAGLAVAGWVLWLIFVGESALRAWAAADQRRFWARNWWQLVFLAVPFLRFVRALSLLRFARVGSVLSAAVRGSRSANRLLSGRVAWLAVLTGVVVLATSQLLCVLRVYDSYADALHDAALATVAAEPLAAQGVSRRSSTWYWRCTRSRSSRRWRARWVHSSCVTARTPTPAPKPAGTIARAEVIERGCPVTAPRPPG